MTRLPTALTLGLLALALSACDSSDDNKTYTPVNNTVPSASPAPTSAPTPTPAPTDPTSPTPTGSTAPNPTATAAPTVTPTATTPPAPTATPLPPTPTPGLNGGRVDSGVPAGATIVVETAPACLACAVNNENGILDADWDNFASATLQLGLLSAVGVGDLSITVNLAEAIDPTVAITTPFGYSELPNYPGFVVSFPDSALLTLTLFPSIEISALMDDTVVATESYGYGLLNLIGIDTILNDINNGRVFLSMPAESPVTEPYNAIRIAFTASAADVLLALDVHQVAIAGITGSISGDVPAPPFP